MPHKTPKIILGIANVGDPADAAVRFDTSDKINALLDEFYAHGYRVLDSARVYPPGKPGTAETYLAAALRESKTRGQHKTDPFVVDTKVWSNTPGSHTPDAIARSVDESVGLLGDVVSIDIEYLHQPDRTVPLAAALGALSAQLQQSKFQRIGISNYRVDEVDELVRIADEHGLEPPRVYQGCYNAVSRDLEADLIPTLRKHGIALYAYSPTAGGLFSEQAKAVLPGSRYDPNMTFGAVYTGKYKTPAIEAAVQRVRDAAAAHQISGHAAALRWIVHHSALSGEHGDGVIIGVSSVEQLRSSLDAIDAGPLPADVLAAVEAISSSISDDEKQGFKF
ncbi:aldo/keto reductase [Ophiostoma piceae UAMH 11346]|uniref:Aldo/keto reductase n=1 Tax=Ophiostoma piceae (strain UAMH 11346) TaxID=1262450 RepID=S3CD16_OPHP1|nr:aldo/keto reductase [Ophiostoma piceae UAMH 11346]